MTGIPVNASQPTTSKFTLTSLWHIALHFFHIFDTSSSNEYIFIQRQSPLGFYTCFKLMEKNGLKKYL